MKLISWNVNGLRACLKKGFVDYCLQEGADVYCLQETKMEEGQADFDLPGYYRYWNSADKKGYSGTAIFTKTEPLSVTCDFGEERILTAGDSFPVSELDTAEGKVKVENRAAEYCTGGFFVL